MCGIAGIYSYHAAAPEVDRQELLRIRDHMYNRGPDGAGEWYSGNNRVGLAHRRLAIIDLSETGSQPMAATKGNYVVTFNGEIYNYKALKHSLEARGYRFESHSDTEVLLHLYAEYGREMVHHLRGMFAFAVWDETKQELFLARDPYGIKPLYYADDGWCFRFASQVKALLSGGGVSRQQDPAGLAGFYLLGSVPEPFTLYQDIRSVPAGSTMTVGTLGSSSPQQYFSMANLWREAEMSPVSGNRQNLVRQAVADSVQHHLVSDVPVGAFLSAGIDSSALVGLMCEQIAPSTIKTICLAFEEFRGSHNDESILAAQVAAHYGTDHSTRYVSEAEFHADLPGILEAMDQPTIDGINAWFVSKAAKDAGLKVAISGLGGDELFGGYPAFSDVPKWVKQLWLPSKIPGLGRAMEMVQERFPTLFEHLNPKAMSMVRYGGHYAGSYLLKRGLFMPHDLPLLMGHDQAALGLERLKPIKLIQKSLCAGAKPQTAFSRIATLEASIYMRNQLLRDTDWASMAHSLEVRVPLVDHILAKQVAKLMVGSGNQNQKQYLAYSPAKPLPPAISERAKTGFTTPIGQWQQRGDDSTRVWQKAPALANTNCPWARRWSSIVAQHH
jgi:asparagine synthase (glutamine-hydrolysing)